MTAASISGFHTRSNPYYPVMRGVLRLSPCHGGELRGLCQLLIYPIAHQDLIGARQSYAFEAALRVPGSVLPYEAVGLQITMLLQKADPISSLPYTHGVYGECVPKGCWHTTGVTLGDLSLLLPWGRDAIPALRGWGGGERIEKGTRRAIEHIAARQGRYDRMA
jgi:hypothetical protein